MSGESWTDDGGWVGGDFTIFPIHSKLRSITPMANQIACDITEFGSVNMDA